MYGPIHKGGIKMGINLEPETKCLQIVFNAVVFA
jgi:hypothetical protein